MRAILAACVFCALALAAHAQTGIASVYWQGRRTASGELLCRSCLTAAHRTLAFGTRVKVTNRRNGRSVIVRINDRGPFVRGRIIDLTPAGARALHFSGLARVDIEVVPTAQR
jgi:rare lipoprotein A